MDLSKVNYAADASKGYTFNLTLPTGEVTDVKLTVIGDMSEEVQLHEKRKYLVPYLDKNKKDKKDSTADELIKDAEDKHLEGALVRLTGWENLEWQGKPVKFSKEKAREILSAVGYSWIQDQIHKEAGVLGNFTQAQSKN